MKFPVCGLLLIFALILVGCRSGHSGNAIVPDPASEIKDQVAPTQPESGHGLFGIWTVSVSADHTSMEAVPLRLAEWHINLVSFLEKYPCNDCVKITRINPDGPNHVYVTIELTHPFPNNNRLAVFDPRFILMTNGNYRFPVNNRNIAWGEDVPKLLEFSGYTALFNPTEFPSSSDRPDYRKYISGKYSIGSGFTATANQFVQLITADTRYRNIFWPPDGDLKANLEFYLPSGPLTFGYALDANWVKVDHYPENEDDFPYYPAHCPDAINIVTKQWDLLSPTSGVPGYISVQVADHQTLKTIKAVTAEAPDLFSGEIPLHYYQPGEGSGSGSGAAYYAQISNSLKAPDGFYPLLITVTDTILEPGIGPTKTYQVMSIRVTDGWIDTWGNDQAPYWLTRSAIDKNGNLYVCGANAGADLDPSPEVLPGSGAYVSRFDNDGKLIWSRSWDSYKCQSVAVDSDGNVYATGEFEYQTDLDPGSGNDEHSGQGKDAYLVKLDNDGNYVWGKTWGGIGEDYGVDLTIDESNNLYITGTFEYEADFDPGPSEWKLASNGGYDVFLTEFDSDGHFLWATSWGSTEGGGWNLSGDYCDLGLNVISHSPGTIYVLGSFNKKADFDPGPGVDEREIPYIGNFLVKYVNNRYQWVDAWPNRCFALVGKCIDTDSAGNIYWTGMCSNMDFDPGENTVLSGAIGGFVLQLDPDGKFKWAKEFTYAGGGECFGLNVTVDSLNNVDVSGIYNWIVDFDPGEGQDLHETHKQVSNFGFQGAGFLAQLDADGNYHWARTFGDNSDCYDMKPSGTVVDHSGNVYVSGYFESQGSGADFDPGLLEAMRLSDVDGGQFLMKFTPDGSW